MRASTRQDWLAAGAVLAALAAVFVIPAAATGTSLARAVAAMALAALLALAVSRAPFTFALRVRSGFVLLVTLALWYTLTRLWAVDPAGSMYEAARVSAFVLLAWAVHTSVVGTAARRALLAGIAACGLYVSVDPLWSAITDGAPAERVAGELGYWNASAAVALVLVPAAVALAGTGSRRLIVLAGLLIPIAGVAATAFASRGALLAVAVALLVQALLDPDYRGGLPRALIAGGTLVLAIVGLSLDGLPVPIALASPALVAIGAFGLVRSRRQPRPERRRPALTALDGGPDASEAAGNYAGPHRPRRPRLVRAIGVLLALSLVALLAALVLDSGTDTRPDTDAEREAQFVTDSSRLTSTDDSERLTWYDEAIEFWSENPIAGRGGAAFAALRVSGRNLNLAHVHSMPIEVLLETGIVGLTLLAAATILLLRVLRQGRRSTERALAGAICAIVLTQSLIDWTLSLPPVLILLAIAGPIALVQPPDPDDETAATAPSRVPAWAAITMLGALAVATTVAFTPMLASILADQAAEAIDGGDYARGGELASQSLQLVPALETLTLQVISLQARGDDAAAADTLRDHETVWLHRLEGLRLAEPYLSDDPNYGPRIDERIDTLTALQDERTP